VRELSSLTVYSTQLIFKEGFVVSAVSLQNVVKRYKRGREFIEVLHQLSLDVPDGDFLALMAPSGSGKTTILNLIGGLDRADSGEVVVSGERLEQLSSGQLANWRAHNVGFIFQFYNLMPMLSAAANVELPLLLTHLSRAERKHHVASALEIVGLSNRAAHKPGELSGGQQQRVGIARAIVTDPTILLCDEPTGDLDRQTADEILGLLRELNRQHKKTIIMVTHDQKAADHASRQLHCDKGILIDADKVAA
jgi:putative ABC transport system ATP-binding protein